MTTEDQVWRALNFQRAPNGMYDHIPDQWARMAEISDAALLYKLMTPVIEFNNWAKAAAATTQDLRAKAAQAQMAAESWAASRGMGRAGAAAPVHRAPADAAGAAGPSGRRSPTAASSAAGSQARAGRRGRARQGSSVFGALAGMWGGQ